MKTFIGTLIIMVSFSVSLFAQNDTFGPKYKNQKPQEKYEGKHLVVRKTAGIVTGPVFKHTPTQALRKSGTPIIARTDKRRKNVFGPAAKNSKPWENK